LAAVDVDYDAAALGVVMHQHAQILLLQHALGHAQERGADGLADAGLAGMVLAGEHRDGRRCGDVHPGHAQDVVDCDACDLHDAALRSPPSAATRSFSMRVSSPAIRAKSAPNCSASLAAWAFWCSFNTSSGATRLMSRSSVSTKDTRSFQVMARRV